MENKNPKNRDDWTPLHSAALHGHLKIADYIVKCIEDKNPKTNSGWTPLHFLANFGYNETFKYILANCVDKNPMTDEIRERETVLHKAAEAGGKP